MFFPVLVQSAPNLDGILDDEAWQAEPWAEDFISYYPTYSEILPHKTQVWMCYDRENLYFAFKCFDPEPQEIKTSITRRDNIFNDDWVGLCLDAMENKQMAYHFFVNPNGIQGDAANSASAFIEEDFSPDFTWNSAGKITGEGYQVEICIPLQSLRFKSKKEVKMGILFRRSISRLGIKGSWPGIEPGQGVFNSHAEVIYRDITGAFKLELLPNFTYGSSHERDSRQQWGDRDTFTDFGIGLKYGITSAIIANLTVNPDFSQVESDALQVEVNRRYPLFYDEKRPFFMEGADIFIFFTLPYGFFLNAVHTRRILEPFWSAKITGNLGKTSFGILSARDNQAGKKAFFGIARGKYSLGKDNYLGFLYSGRESADEYNRVGGADLRCRVFKNQKINISFLYSTSGSEESNSGENYTTHSLNLNFFYSYDTKRLAVDAAFEHMGRNFRMDTSYLMRNGVDQGWIWTGYFFYPDSKKLPWLKRIFPQMEIRYLHDLYTHMDDAAFTGGISFNFTRQAYLEINYFSRQESWQGQTYDISQFDVSGDIQLTKRLQIGAALTWGDKIHYEASPSYKGKGCDGSFTLVFQPINNINQQFNFLHSELTKDNQKIYDVNIFYSRTTYQFNKYFFLRAVLQYDSYQKRLLTDFLASFTLIPGTVLHLGYGGLYESRTWQDNQWVYRQGDLHNIKRSFFLKASYLWRI